MPARYWIDSGRRLVFLRYDGIVTRDDVLTVSRESTGDPAFEVGFDELVDFSAMTGSKVSADDVRALIEAVSQSLDGHGRTWRVAVAAPNDVAFGFARMFELLRSDSPEEVHVFRSLDEACAFMGLVPDDLPWLAPRP